MKETKYRVFDRHDRFQQSYDAVLEGALDWAIACAKYTKGRVMEITFKNGKEISEKQVFPSS